MFRTWSFGISPSPVIVQNFSLIKSEGTYGGRWAYIFDYKFAVNQVRILFRDPESRWTSAHVARKFSFVSSVTYNLDGFPWSMQQTWTFSCISMPVDLGICILPFCMFFLQLLTSITATGAGDRCSKISPKHRSKNFNLLDKYVPVLRCWSCLLPCCRRYFTVSTCFDGQSRYSIFIFFVQYFHRRNGSVFRWEETFEGTREIDNERITGPQIRAAERCRRKRLPIREIEETIVTIRR